MFRDQQCPENAVVIRVPVKGCNRPMQILVPCSLNLTETEARELVKAFRGSWDILRKTKADAPPKPTLREKYPDIFRFGRSNFTPESRSIPSDRREEFYAEPEIKEIVAMLNSTADAYLKTHLFSYPKWLHRGRQVVKGSEAKYTERSTGVPIFTFDQTCPSLPQVLKFYDEREKKKAAKPVYSINQLFAGAVPASFSTDIFL